MEIFKPILSLLCLCSHVYGLEGGLEIKKKERYMTIQHSEDRGKHEIYTSMKDMENFFKEEMEYIEDLRALYDKKLITIEAKQNVGAYIQSFEDVVGDQEEDASFMHNPLNAYNLIRHVAVGWGVVEGTLDDDAKKKHNNIGKRVLKALSRRNVTHVPDQPDLDGIAKGIVRLHDYYKFNTTQFVNEGVLDIGDGNIYETVGDLSVWDAFKIGVKGTNALILGSGLQILDAALEKANFEGVTTPTFIDEFEIKTLKNIVKTAKTVHDQKLDRWGDRTDQHSTNPFPYSKSLAKKKKFQKNLSKMEESIKLNSIHLNRAQETYQYMELCKGRDLRHVSVTSQLFCKFSKGNHPTYEMGPLKVEIISLRPYVVVIHNFILDTEAEEIKAKAEPSLRRSEMVGKNGTGSTDDRRVSEQTWLTEEDSEPLRIITRRSEHWIGDKEY